MPKTKEYIANLEQVLIDYYQKLDLNRIAKPLDKAYLDGFLAAGKAIGITNKELQDSINRVHFDMFKKTIEERRAENALGGENTDSWKIFDEPAWKRK